ncbi:hypothetical protein BG006_007760 [Podila minutissima]|uniref:Uncharacterized protein n=1 Tax=Podila minutissima TaxID=64525 RepID=A0A9P5VQN9_9FUNG|nr:hypothetical protein BG006_007760 [Podila minutissima]
MRFLALLVALATVALTTAMPADDMPMASKSLPVPKPTDTDRPTVTNKPTDIPKPTDLPTPGLRKCNPCLVKNIRKVKACRWWKEKTPWLSGKPEDWNASQKSCVCALSKVDRWLEDCKKPRRCPDEYISKVKLMYAKWQIQVCRAGGKD